jgi:predicted kinase
MMWEILLQAGWPVIVDGAFLKRWQRDLFHDIARRCSAQFRILDIKPITPRCANALHRMKHIRRNARWLLRPALGYWL